MPSRDSDGRATVDVPSRSDVGRLPRDEAVMRQALALAARAPATGDVPVGAVVLGRDGTVLAAACNRREADGDPTAHAEILALRAAARVHGDGWRLTGCTLVVTLEPCTMCAGAAVLARVDRLVYAADDDKAGAVGGLWDVVRDPRLTHRIEVVSGLLADQAAEQLRSFFVAARSRPLVPEDPAHDEEVT